MKRNNENIHEGADAPCGPNKAVSGRGVCSGVITRYTGYNHRFSGKIDRFTRYIYPLQRWNGGVTNRPAVVRHAGLATAVQKRAQTLSLRARCSLRVKGV